MKFKKLSLVICFLFAFSVAYAATCNEITQETNDYRISVTPAEDGDKNGIVNTFTPTVTNQLYKVELDASKDCVYIWEVYLIDGEELAWRSASGDMFGLGSSSPTLTAGKTYSMRVFIKAFFKLSLLNFGLNLL